MAINNRFGSGILGTTEREALDAAENAHSFLRDTQGLGRTVVVRRPGLKESTPAKHKVRRRRVELALGITVPIVLVGLWQLLVTTGALTRHFFPAPSDLWSAGVNLWSSGTMPRYLGDSVQRIIYGYLMGTAAGLLFGLLLGLSPTAWAALRPTVRALWMIPTIAILPLLLYLFGLGTLPVIVLIAITCHFLTLIPTQAAVSRIPEAYREAAESFGANRRQMLRYVVIPAALPQIAVALQLAAGASVLVMVAGEFLDGKSGVGYMIFNSYQLFAIPQMYVGIATVSVLGALWMSIVGGLGSMATRWQRAGR